MILKTLPEAGTIVSIKRNELKELLVNLFKRDRKRPPKKVRANFILGFPEAINQEWTSEGIYWEVVFYHEQKEKIAKIDNEGKLEELRTNNSLSDLPDTINNSLKAMGEIMNAISIKRGGTVHWEIIYRDEKLARFVCNVDESGQVISIKKL